MTQHRRANFFAQDARQRGDVETNNTTARPQQGTAETGITSAPENCTKNAHFSPAKAMAVSVEARPAPAKAMTVSVEAQPAPTKATTVSTPHRYQQAKATPVSGERAPAHEHTRHHRCGGRRRDLPRCRWAVAGPGRASRRRAERSSQRGRLAGGPPPTGTYSGRALRHPPQRRRAPSTYCAFTTQRAPASSP